MKHKKILYKLHNYLLKLRIILKKHNKASILNRKINYNRAKAKVYAEQFAEKPNILQYPYYKGNDCTNFVSQVLKAGGIKEVGDMWDSYGSWFCRTIDSSNKGLKNVSITWRAARYFRKHWGNDNGIGINRSIIFEEIKVIESLTDFSYIYNRLEVGDVIQYIDFSKGNYPYHSQVIHRKGYNKSIARKDIFIAQHTSNKKNVSLYEYLSKLDNKDKSYICIYHI
jgi:hypothetical protein